MSFCRPNIEFDLKEDNRILTITSSISKILNKTVWFFPWTLLAHIIRTLFQSSTYYSVHSSTAYMMDMSGPAHLFFYNKVD